MSLHFSPFMFPYSVQAFNFFTLSIDLFGILYHLFTISRSHQLVNGKYLLQGILAYDLIVMYYRDQHSVISRFLWMYFSTDVASPEKTVELHYRAGLSIHHTTSFGFWTVCRSSVAPIPVLRRANPHLQSRRRVL